MDVPLGWIQFDGWEETHQTGSHRSLTILLNTRYVVGLQQVRDGEGTMVLVSQGRSYVTLETVAALAAQMGPHVAAQMGTHVPPPLVPRVALPTPPKP